MEIGKTIRALGTHGHSYEEAVGAATDYIAIAEEEHLNSQHAFADEEDLTSAVGAASTGDSLASTATLAPERTDSVLRAWVAADAATVRLLHEARSIARTSSTVLIRGESGTGKDLMAWILHALSPRADRPLVRVDCASLPPELIESELFGQEFLSGQFGRLELAAGGTLVLDEVSALSIPAQAKLLRVIEERRFERLGGARSIGVDTRIIALSTSNLEHAVTRRTFREDLYYRLNVIPMIIPALRERTGDIRPLATHFAERFSATQRRPRLSMGPAVVAALEGYSWPGNVRELRSVIEKAVLSATGPEIALTDLPQPVRDCAAGSIRTKMSLEELERSYIAEVLEHTRGKKTMAAKILGISRKTLLEKRKRYGLE